jgi:hypothetical protein
MLDLCVDVSKFDFSFSQTIFKWVHNHKPKKEKEKKTMGSVTREMCMGPLHPNTILSQKIVDVAIMIKGVH